MKTVALITLILVSICALFWGYYSLSNKTKTNTNTNTRSYEWGTFNIGGGGFVSGIVTGKREMYLRTDVGGAYKYDYENKKWVQLFDFINEEKRGFLSIKGIAIDPTNDDIAYFLCGCAYFSEAKTVIYKTTDGGKTFKEIDVTNLIQTHGNGDGRQCSEPIAIDPDNPNTIYVGGDVTSGESALIKSTDGGETWKPVKGYDDLGLFKYNLNYPSWTEHSVRGSMEAEYYQQNGIASIKILNKKIYIATSVKGQENIHVADIDKDEFKILSSDLPKENYPMTIKDDSNGNLFITYIAGLAFDGSAGGAFKYNIETGEVTNISPSEQSIGMISSNKNDPNKLVARTCGCWLPQWWAETSSEESTVYGDFFFKSNDGGKTWINITPGQQRNSSDGNSYFISRPFKDNGYKWIINKSIHWGSTIIFDPRNENRIIMLSGNGIFACDNVWDEKDIQFYFDPKGEEEVVPADLISVKNGPVYSAIFDYDGFIHKNVEDIPTQYVPNMGSTNLIAYCKENPNIMMRISSYNEIGYYSKDAGITWEKMEDSCGSGGKGAITKIDNDKYRFFHVNDSGIAYSDDYGKTWEKSEGLSGNNFGIFAEDSDPKIVYFYSHLSQTEQNPNQNILGVSTDSGKTFTTKVISEGEQSSERIAYVSKGKIIVAAGTGGAYLISNFGEKVEKMENVYYCKTIGYGIMEKDEEDNTLYMYGKPSEKDQEGIYRSQDCGKTWLLINSNKLYGGTGNANFLVGDMNTFGTVYMSSVGCGIIYGRLK